MKLGRENKNTHFKKKKNDGRVGRGDGAPFLASVRPAFDTQDSNTDILSSTFSICESPQRAPEETTLSHADFTVSVIPASRGAPSSALAPRREPRRRVLPLPEAARRCLRRRERRRARPPRPGGRRRGERRGARAAARSGLAAAGRLRRHRRHRRRCAIAAAVLLLPSHYCRHPAAMPGGPAAALPPLLPHCHGRCCRTAAAVSVLPPLPCCRAATAVATTAAAVYTLPQQYNNEE